MRAFFWAAWLGLCSTPLLAAPLQGFSFAQKDWELACDNTGACRAAGYGVRMGEVSVLLARNAGSEQHLTATVTFAQIEHDIPADSTASLLIDDRDFGALDALDDSHFRLDSDQTTALLQALTNQRKIEFTLNGQHLPLSSAGSREVLGKM
ncbi:TPA: DUF1176 domain-containing protein, partial [Klebsiella pneumoniae]|nr:DUF1176 domain-containing protein [Klebsiella pneumoniae]